MLCLSNLSYKDRLLSLKLDSLHLRRINVDLIMRYKIFNGLVAIDCSDFFYFPDYDRTRGHNFYILCVVWNTLSHDVVNAFSVSSFKRKLDTVNLDLTRVI